MKTRRIIAVLAAFVMAAAFAGCGAKDKEDNDKTGSSSVAEQSKKSDSSTAESTEDQSVNPDDEGKESVGSDSEDSGNGNITAEGFVYREDNDGGRIVQGDLKDGVFDGRLLTFNVNSDVWTLEDEDAALVTTAYLRSNDNSSAVSVIADKIDTTKQTVPTLDEAHDINIKDLEAMGCKDIENKDIEIDGEKGYLTTATTDLGDGIIFRFTFVECFHGDLHLVMNLNGIGDGFEAASEDFIKMAESVKFTD